MRTKIDSFFPLKPDGHAIFKLQKKLDFKYDAFIKNKELEFSKRIKEIEQEVSNYKQLLNTANVINVSNVPNTTNISNITNEQLCDAQNKNNIELK